MCWVVISRVGNLAVFCHTQYYQLQEHPKYSRISTAAILFLYSGIVACNSH
jgi:hypothetical protein